MVARRVVFTGPRRAPPVGGSPGDAGTPDAGDVYVVGSKSDDLNPAADDAFVLQVPASPPF